MCRKKLLELVAEYGHNTYDLAMRVAEAAKESAADIADSLGAANVAEAIRESQ